MRTHWVPILMVALFLTPAATAGTAEDPELSDESGDASPAAANEFADITAGWVNETRDALILNLQLASFPQTPPEGEIYSLQFQQDAASCTAFYGAMIVNQSANEITTGLFDLCNNQVVTSETADGDAPSSDAPQLTVEMPRTILNRSYQGATLLNFSAVTYNYYPFFGCIVPGPACEQAAESAFHDLANENSTYTLRQGPQPPENATAGTDDDGSGNESQDASNQTNTTGTPNRAAPDATNESPSLSVVIWTLLALTTAWTTRRRNEER